MSNYFEHPCRFKLNAEGPFYTTGCPSAESECGMIGDCLQCEAPEHEAPDLLAELNEANLDTYFVRQPKTGSETNRACNAMKVCCVAALRYGGTNRSIIKKLDNNPEYCDYIDVDGELKRTVDDYGDLLPFATNIMERLRNAQSGPDA